MSHWELTYKQYPTKLKPTTEDARNIPVVFSNWFITHDKGDRVRFAQFGNEAVWNVDPDSPWVYQQTNLTVPHKTLESALPYFDQLANLDVYTRLATYNKKSVAWHRPTQTWKYRNNRTVHFNQTPTEGTNSALNSEEEASGTSSNEDSEKLEEDTAQVEDLLKQAETTVISAIQKLSSRAGTPEPTNSPLPKASLLPGKSKLSTTEISQTATPPISKGKAPAPPPTRTSTSSSSPRPTQTVAISSTTKPSAPPS